MNKEAGSERFQDTCKKCRKHCPAKSNLEYQLVSKGLGYYALCTVHFPSCLQGTQRKSQPIAKA